MSDDPHTPGTTAITDRRPVPRGVMPRSAQTWLMAGIAGVMVLIMFVAGRPEQGRSRAIPAVPPTAPSPERLRDYQDRLRVMEARAAQEAQSAVPQSAVGPQPPSANPESAGPATPDPVAAERRRRNYESLFASNVVLSRRPEAERPDAARLAPTRSSATPAGTNTPLGGQSLDDLADAVVRATTRVGANTGLPAVSQRPNANPVQTADENPRETQTAARSASVQRLLEGTVVDAVLTNRLDGATAGPVNCLVTNAVYSHSGQEVLIPAGARILGETKPVQSFGEMRLAVAFHRLVMPDGITHALDGPPALNQIGDAGLHDQVNQHYWSTFGASAAIGLISGLAQFVGTAGFAGSGDRTVILAGPADASAQASMQVMNRLLNRLPTITIREGHRVKIYLTKDLELPAYARTAGL